MISDICCRGTVTGCSFISAYQHNKPFPRHPGKDINLCIQHQNLIEMYKFWASFNCKHTHAHTLHTSKCGFKKNLSNKTVALSTSNKLVNLAALGASLYFRSVTNKMFNFSSTLFITYEDALR